MNSEILASISDIDPNLWDQMLGSNSTPFMRHAFLLALEQHGCVSEQFGWIPQHQILRHGDGQILGAAPMYLKDNSYGEFVFDWAWADAYYRSNLRYYPKLVIAVPYTPVTGPRLLVNNDPLYDFPSNDAIMQQLSRNAIAYAEAQNLSSSHILFPTPTTADRLVDFGLMTRIACQFHWHNRKPDAYKNFDDFLGQLSSRKRKNIVRERKSVQQAQVDILILHGDEISECQWRDYHRHYTSTFNRLGGYATLSLEFFQEIGRKLPQQTVLIQAYKAKKAIASAFCMRDDKTLYGRHWGCDAAYKNLHFELCYYQGIEYSINHGLQKFEPGAQGEHKLSRGFLPTLTYSAHWIKHPEFRHVIESFLSQEAYGIKHYQESLMQHSPYKQKP